MTGAEVATIAAADRLSRSGWDEADALLAECPVPVLVTLGNHDAYSCAERRMAGRELFRTFFGREPDGVVARHGAWHIAVLDSVEYSMSPFDAFDLVAGAFVEGLRGAIVRGALSDAQHDLLADIAAPGAAPAFVFMHHPPQPFTGFPPVIFGLRDADSGRLHAACDSGNVWGVFCGHTHRNRRGRGFDGVPTQEVAAPRDWPCGYALIDARASGFDYRFVQLSDRDAVRGAYERAGGFVRRYALGSPSDRAFAWSP
jgi:3',5'-cyclic AMP phosphodiesterase CpdA